MKQQRKINIVIGVIILFLFLQSTMTFASPLQSNTKKDISNPNTLGSEYDGHLKIYIVEIESRWDMKNGLPYEHAFFDFAFDNLIEIPYLSTYDNNITWQGDIEEDNVLILAAIFNPEPHRNYADPPIGRPFDAYYIDAAAGVHPGETESNVKDEDFTHTVICEVGTATWCPSCPGMADTLENIYRQDEYPFYYVEMVTDMNGFANGRMNDYNQKYLPTGFYDGGYELIIGGGASVEEHKTAIETAGKRDVHDLDFTLSAEWIANGEIDITINITNNEELPNRPPEKPTIDGPEKGKTGNIQEFQISTTDPDEDQVYFMIDWADGEITEWLGPYESGETMTAEHSWDENGNYIVKVKAKDPDGEQTDWTWHRVSMPKCSILQYQISDFLSNNFHQTFIYQWILKNFDF